MSIEITTEQEAALDQGAGWSSPSPPTDLIFDDGEPLETNRHRIAMNVLIDSVLRAMSNREDFFVGGNMFVYYSRNQAMNRDFQRTRLFCDSRCRRQSRAPGLGCVGGRRTLS